MPVNLQRGIIKYLFVKLLLKGALSRYYELKITFKLKET